MKRCEWNPRRYGPACGKPASVERTVPIDGLRDLPRAFCEEHHKTCLMLDKPEWSAVYREITS